MARCDKRNWYRERESRRTVLRPKRNLQRAPKNQLSVFNSILSALKCKSVCYLPCTYKVFIYTIYIYTIYLPIYILYICYINVFSINQAESKGTLCGSQANCWQNFKLLSETCRAHLTPANTLPPPPTSHCPLSAYSTASRKAACHILWQIIIINSFIETPWPGTY